MYGTQTAVDGVDALLLFENDVKMYGTQTKNHKECDPDLFENDVKMYGTQTNSYALIPICRLRMM